MSFIVWLIIGAVAGLLAGIIVKGYGFGIIGNIIVGIVGAAIGNFLLPRTGIMTEPTLIGQIIVSTIGAVLFLLVIGVARRRA